MTDTATPEVQDEFAAAFDQFATKADEPVEQAPADAPAAADPAPAAGGDPAGGVSDADPAGDAGGGDPGSGAGDGGDAAPVDEAPAPAEGDKATDDLIARLASLVKDKPADPAPPAAQREPEPEPQPEPQVDLYSDEEKAFLTDYDKDWADVARGEALKRRAEYNRLTDFIFNQVAQELLPYIQTVQRIADADHYNDLRARVEDYDDVRDQVIAWVDEQPDYLQPAYKSVIKSGTPEQVADLVGRYKQEKGLGANPAPTPAPRVELSDDAKKAAATLAPVTTKRSVMPQTEDLSDFSSAFDAWATKGKL